MRVNIDPIRPSYLHLRGMYGVCGLIYGVCAGGIPCLQDLAVDKWKCAEVTAEPHSMTIPVSHQDEVYSQLRMLHEVDIDISVGVFPKVA